MYPQANCALEAGSLRAVAIVITSILLATPLAASLDVLTRPALPAPTFDPSDAELMLFLARLDHPTLQPLAPPTRAGTEPLPDILARISLRAQAPLTPDEAAHFSALDPRVADPLVTLFLAVEKAWDAYDLATARITTEEMIELHALRQAGEEGTPRGLQLVSQIDQETLLAAAIMLTSVVESEVVPQLQAAADANAWPTNGAWDPVGILRLGSTGDDLEALDRILQIDPRGNDTYTNNAGGATTLDPVIDSSTWNIATPIAISIDFAGNDRYDTDRITSSLGASPLGLGYGLLLDFAGDDHYTCRGECIGEGLGLMRDYAGNDQYDLSAISLGVGFPLGIARDDAGDDYYRLSIHTAGFSNLVGMAGLLWDRGGADYYASLLRVDNRLGWGNQGGRGWFVDEGLETDVYETADSEFPSANHGCNDCTWEIGTPYNGFPVAGEGNDNSGGLSHLLFRQDPVLRQLP